MYPALSTYNIEFVTLAVGTMKLVEREFLLCKWSSFGLSAGTTVVSARLIETTLFLGKLLM